MPRHLDKPLLVPAEAGSRRRTPRGMSRALILKSTTNEEDSDDEENDKDGADHGGDDGSCARSFIWIRDRSCNNKG